MANVKTRWLASLSNGRTAIEGQDDFDEVPGEPSPWQKLKRYLQVHDLHITAMRVQTFKELEANKTFNLPSMSRTPKGNHEKWAALRPKFPVDFNYFRWVTKDLTGGEQSHQIEIRAEYQDFFVSLFVDEDTGNESWVVVHEKGAPK